MVKYTPNCERIENEVSVARKLLKELRYEACINHIKRLRLHETSPHYGDALQLMEEAQKRLKYIDLIESGKAEYLILVPEQNKIFFKEGDSDRVDDERSSIDDILDKILISKRNMLR